MSSVVKLFGFVQTYPIADGSIFRDYYNETLDNGLVNIVQVEKLEIEPYDLLEISFDSGITFRKFFVLQIQETIASFNPARYNYSIVYVSKTIQLQKIVLPNISNTRRKSSSKTVYQKINELNEVYGLRKRVTSPFVAHVLQYPISTRLQNFTNTPTCIEFSLQAPNMFEAFNVILSPLKAIITINASDELDYILLTEKKLPIDITTFNEVVSVKNGAEYASDLQSDAINSVGNSDQAIATTEWITPRRFSGGALLPRDAELSFYTQYPIYKILKVELEVAINPTPFFLNSDISIDRIDITSQIIEKDIYDLLEPDNILTLGFDDYTPEARKWFAYYQIGSNEIKNVFFGQSFWSRRTFFNFLNSRYGDDWVDLGNLLNQFFLYEDIIDVPGLSSGIDYREIKMRITYIPLTATKMITSKYLPTKYNVVLPNSQQDTFVDINRFGISNQQTANRIGTPQLTAVKRFSQDFTAIPQLADYYGNFILAEREIAINDGFINFKGSFFENYVQKTFFSGINSKRRMWAIAKAEEAIERSDVFKVNAEFSFENRTEIDFEPYNNNQHINSLVLAIFSKFRFWTSGFPSSITSKKIIGAVIVPTYASGTGPEVFIEIAKYVAGRSLLFTFSMYDNYAAGLQVHKELVSGPLQKLVPYTDLNGENVSLSVKLLSDTDDNRFKNLGSATGTFIKTRDDHVVDYPNVSSFTSSYGVFPNFNLYKDEIKRTSWKLPATNTGMYDNDDVVTFFNFLNYKDNREKTRLTYQLEFTSNTKNIVVTDIFALWCALVNSIDRNVRIYYSTTEEYELDATQALGTQITNETPFQTIQTNQIVLSSGVIGVFSSVGQVNIKSWGLATQSGILLLGVNKGSNTLIPLSVFLNFLKYRQ